MSLNSQALQAFTQAAQYSHLTAIDQDVHSLASQLSRIKNLVTIGHLYPFVTPLPCQTCHCGKQFTARVPASDCCGGLLGAQHFRERGRAVGGGSTPLVRQEGRAPLQAQQLEHLVVVAHLVVGGRQQLVPCEYAVGASQEAEGLQSDTRTGNLVTMCADMSQS